MKNLITTLAVLIIVVALIFQIGTEMRMAQIQSELMTSVDSYKGIARLEGEFTPELKKLMKNELTDRYSNIGLENVKIESDENIVKLGNKIPYKITFTLKGVVAANKFFGIEDTKNKQELNIEGWLVSEYTGRN